MSGTERKTFEGFSLEGLEMIGDAGQGVCGPEGCAWPGPPAADVDEGTGAVGDAADRAEADSDRAERGRPSAGAEPDPA